MRRGRLLGLGVLAAVIAATAVAPPASWAAPNVLFIVTDDQSLAGTMAVMPKTRDWFGPGAGGGTEYTNGVVTTPLCCPSRSSIMTGQYAHNHGVRNNHQASSFPHTESLQYYLGSAAGGPDYRTGIAGKLLNGWSLTQNPPYWDDWWIFSAHQYAGLEFNEQGVRKSNWRYSTDTVADRAVGFLQDANADDDARPWFLYLAPLTPHGAYTPAPKYADDAVTPLPKPSSYFEADRTDKPPWVRTLGADEDVLEEEWMEQLRMLKSADDLVDRVMTELEALGEDEDTLAVFVSDNGLMWGEHGMNRKQVPYLENLRVPFYVRWPAGGFDGSDPPSTRLVANVDLAATALDAAGVDAPAGSPLDGQSLLTAPPRTRLLTEGWNHATAPSSGVVSSDTCDPVFAGLHTTTFHYVEHYASIPGAVWPNCVVAYGSVTFREYYDIRPGQDPLEEDNLLADDDPRNDPPVRALSARLAADRICEGQAGSQRCDATATLVDTRIAYGPSDPSGPRSEFFFTSSIPNSTFECRLDDVLGLWTPCPSHLADDLAPGPHQLDVRAIGPDGSADATPESYEWSVTAGPDTTVTSHPDRLTNDPDAAFTFTSPTPGSFQCKLDGQSAFSPCSSSTTFADVDDGVHRLEVRAVDLDGIPDPGPAYYMWTVDTTPPEVSLDDADTSPHRSNATFGFSDPGQDAARFMCSLDSNAWRICWEKKHFENLATGGHTFRVKTVDQAGNESSVATHSWSVTSIQVYKNLPRTGWPQVAARGQSPESEVKTIIPDGSQGWFIGGDFDAVIGTEVAGQPATTLPRTDLAHIKADGTVDPVWKPSTDGTVEAMIAANGLILIGGSFTAVGPTPDAQPVPRGNLTAITFNGAVSNAWNPDANKPVHAMGSRRLRTGAGEAPKSIYVAGEFTTIGAASRSKVAEIGIVSGAADYGQATAWSPEVNNTASLLALLVTERNVYIGGTNLDTVNGIARPNLAEIDRYTGQVTDWNPSPDGVVYTLDVNRAFSDNLPTLYAGGAFDTIGNPPRSRNRAAEVNLTDTGSVTAWDPSPGNGGLGTGIVRAFVPASDSSWACGTGNCATLLGGNFSELMTSNPPTILRERGAEVNRATGLPNAWLPQFDGAPTDFVRGSSYLAVAGNFTGRIAFFDELSDSD